MSTAPQLAAPQPPTITLSTVRQIKEALAGKRPVFATRHDGKLLPVDDAAMGGTPGAPMLRLRSGEQWYRIERPQGLVLWAGTAWSKRERWLANGRCFCPACLGGYKPTRFFFTCAKCRRRWTRDYYRDTARYAFRLEDGKVIPWYWDKRCPSCQGRAEGKELSGHYKADHKCDARCENATGPDCTCACGGARHGINHLLG